MLAEINQTRPRLVGLARQTARSQEPVKYRVHSIDTQWPQLRREEQMIVIRNDSRSTRYRSSAASVVGWKGTKRLL
jgi:hypothetical protein